jgi:sarcosine oxidase
MALYQRDGGIVDAALSNSTHIQLAMGRGAKIIDSCPVKRIDTNPDGTATVMEIQMSTIVLHDDHFFNLL